MHVLERDSRSQAVLRNRKRSEIFSVISDTPGLRKSEIGRMTDISWSTLSYHIHVLIQNELVITNGNKVFFSKDFAKDPRNLLISSIQKNILDHVKENGYTNQRTLARELGLSKTTLQRNLKKMVHIDISDI